MGEGQKSRLKMAIILNALAMPGIGYIYLGRKLKGYVISVVTVIFVVVPIAKYAMLSSYALNILTKSATTGIPTLNVYNAMSYAWPGAKKLVLISALAIVILWVYGIVELYLEYRKEENR